MKLARIQCVVISALLLGLSACSAHAKEAPGLAVGEASPAFELTDQNGKQHASTGLIEEGKMLAVVFHRSAVW